MADQLQREIEEILSKLDEFVPEPRRGSRVRKRAREVVAKTGSLFSVLVSRVSLGHLMLVSLLLLFVAFAFRSSAVGQYSLFAGLALLGITIFLSFISNRRPSAEKRWRGQVVDLSEPSLLDKLQGWLKKRRTRSR